MSDYIDELVAREFGCSCSEYFKSIQAHDPESSCRKRDEADDVRELARAVAERVKEAERAKRVECERALASASRALYIYGFKPGSDGAWRPDPPYWNPPPVPPTGEQNGDLYRAKMEIARLTEELHRALVKLEEANKPIDGGGQ